MQVLNQFDIRGIDPKKGSCLKLSVVISTYNRAEQIGKTLAILEQCERHDVEYIIRNNGSSDNTEVILKKIQFDKRFRVSNSRKNVGLDVNLNEAISSAIGEFIWLMSDDDLDSPCTIALVAEYLNTFNGDYLYVEYDEDKDQPFEHEDFENEIKFIQKNLLRNSFISSNIIKREKWFQNKPLEYAGTAFDYLYVIYNCIQNGAKISMVRGAGLQQRQVPIAQSRARYSIEYYEKAFYSIAEYMRDNVTVIEIKQVFYSQGKKSIDWFIFSGRKSKQINLNQSLKYYLRNRHFFGWSSLGVFFDLVICFAPLWFIEFLRWARKMAVK